MTKLIVAFRTFANAPKNQNTNFMLQTFFRKFMRYCRRVW